MLGLLLRGSVVTLCAVALAAAGAAPGGNAPTRARAPSGCLTEGSGAQETSLVVRIDMVSEDPGCHTVGGAVTVWREVRPAAGRW